LSNNLNLCVACGAGRGVRGVATSISHRVDGGVHA
jgi:hypothetical protein